MQRNVFWYSAQTSLLLNGPCCKVQQPSTSSLVLLVAPYLSRLALISSRADYIFRRNNGNRKKKNLSFRDGPPIWNFFSLLARRAGLRRREFETANESERIRLARCRVVHHLFFAYICLPRTELPQAYKRSRKQKCLTIGTGNASATRRAGCRPGAPGADPARRALTRRAGRLPGAPGLSGVEFKA